MFCSPIGNRLLQSLTKRIVRMSTMILVNLFLLLQLKVLVADLNGDYDLSSFFQVRINL